MCELLGTWTAACRSEVTLQQFEQLAEPVLDRVLKPCEDALKIAGLTAEQISSVEMVGGASRTPAIVRKVADFFKQEPKRSGSFWRRR